MRSFLSSWRLQQKIFLFLAILISFIFILLFVGLWIDMRNRLITQQDEKMREHLLDLTNMCDLHKEDRQSNIDKASKIANVLFSQAGNLKEDSTQMLTLNVRHQETQNVTRLNVPTWYLGKQKLHFNFDFVDNVEKMIGFGCTIFQKIPQGFLRISSTPSISDKNTRGLNSYIPNTSPIVKAIMQDKNYSGVVKNMLSPVLTHYIPLKIKGKIVGMMAVGGTTKDDILLEEKIIKRKYFNTGQVFAMSGNGTLIYHSNPLAKGIDLKIQDNAFYTEILMKKNGNKRYFIDQTIEIKKGVKKRIAEWRWQYFTYYEPFDMYIAIAVPEYNFITQVLNEITLMLVFILFTLLMISLYAVNILLTPLLKPLNKIEGTIRNLSVGKIPDILTYQTEDEIGEICNSVNILIESLKKYTNFANEIGKNNLEADLKLINNEDKFGEVLIKMRDNLKKTREENEIRSWAIEQNIIISETLRKYAENIDTLSEKVLDFFIHNLPAQQGAFYVVGEDQHKNKYLDMKISYAYQRTKMIKKHIDVEEGLLGQVYKSGKYMYLEELPKNYLTFVTGLEELEASYLLIVPIKIGQEIFGILELVSFYPLPQYKIDFVNLCSESVASSMSITQSNELTNDLLIDMQETAERLMQQDEELRQNLEEMEVLKEVAENKQIEIEKLLENAKYSEEQTNENIKLMQIESLQKQNEYKKIIEKYEEDEKILKQEIENLKKQLKK